MQKVKLRHVDLYTFDDNYVTRLRDGDRWTEEHFLRYFNELLLIKLRGKIRSKQAIDDIRQEVFVRVFRALRTEGIRDGRKLGAFVNSVCNNVLLEWYRSASRTEALESEREDVPDDIDLEAIFASAETAVIVRGVLDHMPKKDADLLRAVFLEERNKDEVCRAFKVDRDYLRVLLHRAREKFRSEYQRTPNVVPFG
jgi:RNA polymerase sigma-70 factor (ECF subfamily)